MSDVLHLLIIEDVETDAELLLREVRKAGYEPISRVVQSRAEMLAALDAGRWDAILSDYNVPGFGALEALQLTRERRIDAPFIIISGAIGEESAVEALKAGVDDIVMKSKLSRVAFALERTLRERQTRLAQEQLLGVVSHDLKNPLGAIQLNLQIIQRALDAPSAQDPAHLPLLHKQIRSHVERAQKSSQRMLRMIQDLLDQTKIHSGQLQLARKRESGDELISQLLELYQPLALQKSILLESDIGAGDAHGDYDAERIFQALGNLVSNAIKFTPPRGHVRLWFEGDDRAIRFFVRDSGPGIPPENLPHIFDRFWQARSTERQGIGLGLSIAKGIALAHGGEIRVQSVLGQGTTFEIELPRWTAEGPGLTAPPVLAGAAALPAGKPRVFLVDDDPDMQEVLGDVLGQLGCEVTRLESAEAALQACEAPAQTPPDLMVIDFQLPGMNGGQLIERVKGMGARWSAVPVLLASADDHVRAADLGIQAHIRKPPSLNDFMQAVRAQLPKG